MADPPVPGLHHVTALSGAAQETLDFFAGVLGLRLVKKTVNFDDPMTHHLYYGDTVGRPGTLLTFFPWPQARAGRAGAGMVQALSFAVPEGALDDWRARLAEADASVEPFHRLGERGIRFEGPAGLSLELVASGTRNETAWTDGPVPDDRALQAFHAPTLPVFPDDRTPTLFVDLFGWETAGEEEDRVRLQAPGSDLAARVDLQVRDRHPSGRMGRGAVHHLAFRVPNDETQKSLRAELRARDVQVTDVKDRRYFRSIYFRDPNWTSGVLFEIATDGPGFLTDENEQALGSGLQLPPWMEERRPQIEDALPSLDRPSAS